MKKTLIMFLLVLYAAAQMPCLLLSAEDIPENKLMYTGIDDNGLEKEAESLGIPAGDMNVYVSGMRNLNQSYRDGDLTRAEYIGAKRRFIENIK